MADTSIVLNNGSGGASLATYVDTGSVNHERVVLETQTGASDPVHVNATNPLPVTAASLPLPAGAATAAKQPALGTAGAASTDVLSVQGVASMTALKVDGSAVTQPVSGTVTANAGSGTMAVSAASLPLPSGASTSAKQPALGTAGSASTDVISVQGIASMTALKVDGSAVTQPVSGTVTVNQGTAAAGSAAWPVNVVEDTSNTVVHPGDATNKAIRVNVVAGAGSGGTALADGTTFTRGTTSETPIAGIAETSNPSLTTGKAAALSLDLNGNLRVVSSGSGGGSSIADGATFTRGTTAETTAGGIAETSAPSLTTGKAASLSLNLAGGLRVDGSGVTQPVSGTVTANIGTSGSLALDASVTGLQVAQGSTTSGEKGTLIQGAVTTAAPTYTTAQTSPFSLDISGNLRTTVANGITSGTAGSPAAQVVTVQGVASMTKLLVTPDSVALPSHQSVNVDQLNGTTTDTNSGNKSAGTLRVVLATDQPALTNALKVDPSAVTSPVSIAATVTVTDVPATSGGWSKWSTPHDNSNAPLTAKASVKGSAGQLGGYIIYNPNASVAYVQVFDAATTGAVTLGTTRPDVVIPIPATSGANIEFGKGVAFASGIIVAATTTDSGSTAVGTGLTCTFLFK